MSVQALIPIISDNTMQCSGQLVDARALHEFLAVDARFNDWFARRLAEYGFQQDEDFYSTLSKSTGGRRSKEYRITLDMAKELAMVERNEKGRQARRYFIECEKALKKIAPDEAKTILNQTIGTDGFHMLGAVVKGKVCNLPQSAQRRATAKIWSQTHAAFGVRSAADIPASQLDAARNFVAAYVLEGEWLGRATAPAGTIVSKGEMLWINSLIVNAEELSRLVVQHGICDHLREVGSPIASSMTGRTLETQMSCNQVRDSLGAALEAASAWASRVCDAPIKRLA